VARSPQAAALRGDPAIGRETGPFHSQSAVRALRRRRPIHHYGNLLALVQSMIATWQVFVDHRADVRPDGDGRSGSPRCCGGCCTVRIGRAARGQPASSVRCGRDRPDPARAIVPPRGEPAGRCPHAGHRRRSRRGAVSALRHRLSQSDAARPAAGSTGPVGQGSRSTPGSCRSRSGARSQPAAGESRPPQPSDDVWAVAHQAPHHTRPVVLDHRDDRPLVDAVVPR
jgi:hypothetical protein